MCSVCRAGHRVHAIRTPESIPRMSFPRWLPNLAGGQTPSSSERKGRSLFEPTFPPGRLGHSDVRQQAQGYLGPVRRFPGHESEPNTRMTVLSTRCSWDISPMICSHSSDAASRLPAGELQCSGLLYHGKLHASQQGRLETRHWLPLGQILPRYL